MVCQEDSPLRPFGTKRTLVCLIGILNIPSITIALPTRRGMELVLLHHFCDESSVAFTYSLISDASSSISETQEFR